MRILPRFSPFGGAGLVAAPLLALAALAPSAAFSASNDPAFQRHFWRGQHGHGNIDHNGDRSARADTGFASAEALVEEGTRGEAIARRARRR